MDAAQEIIAAAMKTTSRTVLGRTLGAVNEAAQGGMDYTYVRAMTITESGKLVGYRHHGSPAACSGMVLTSGQTALIDSFRDDRCRHLLQDCAGFAKRFVVHSQHDTYTAPRTHLRVVLPRVSALGDDDGMTSHPHSPSVGIPPPKATPLGALGAAFARTHAYDPECACATCLAFDPFPLSEEGEFDWEAVLEDSDKDGGVYAELAKIMKNRQKMPRAACAYVATALKPSKKTVSKCCYHAARHAADARRLDIFDLTVPTILMVRVNRLATSFAATTRNAPDIYIYIYIYTYIHTCMHTTSPPIKSLGFRGFSLIQADS